MGCCTAEVEGGNLGTLNPIEKMKKKLWRVRNCGIGWMGISLLLFIIGIVLLVYFAKYIPGDHNSDWVGGIIGIAFLCLGFLGLAVGIIIIVVFCMAFKRSQDRMSGQPMTMTSNAHKGQFPDGLYPKQKGFIYPGQTPAQPSAPADAPADGGHDNSAVTPDEIVIEPSKEKF
ncbi:uncharacterized protein LOC135503213 [Lineus longissimus]|uniref:uncharacterized protein LOC135503213 n=1 Tax=Lineus longissimus TaxID=88925 RepID=UPI002B4EE286